MLSVYNFITKHGMPLLLTSTYSKLSKCSIIIVLNIIIIVVIILVFVFLLLVKYSIRSFSVFLQCLQGVLE